MAQKTQVTLVDDIDGSEATQTVSFALDGASYEIDLNDRNASELKDAFAPYVGSARKAGRGPAQPSGGAGRRPRRAAAGSDREKTQAVREWARSNGFTVSDRGRLSGDVLAAYAAANPGS